MGLILVIEVDVVVCDFMWLTREREGGEMVIDGIDVIDVMM